MRYKKLHLGLGKRQIMCKNRNSKGYMFMEID
jgi:hypothetical protein